LRFLSSHSPHIPSETGEQALESGFSGVEN
jgi:hypothetical protein